MAEDRARAALRNLAAQGKAEGQPVVRDYRGAGIAVSRAGAKLDEPDLPQILQIRAHILGFPFHQGSQFLDRASSFDITMSMKYGLRSGKPHFGFFLTRGRVGGFVPLLAEESGSGKIGKEDCGNARPDPRYLMIGGKYEAGTRFGVRQKLRSRVLPRFEISTRSLFA